jgi:hypothetical protein
VEEEMRTRIRAQWQGMVEDAVFKMFEAVVRSKDHSSEFYELGVRIQKKSEEGQKEVASITAENFIKELVKNGYDENYSGEIPDDFAEKNMRKCIYDAVDQIENRKEKK